MTQYSNQFAQTQEKGALTLEQNFNVFNTKVSASESTALVPGQAVVISDVASSIPVVTAATAITDAVFGFVVYNVRTESYAANSPVKVAADGCVQVMEAGAAIAAGATVMLQISGQKVVTHTSTNTKCGIALDKAAADGDLIRVLIKTPQP